MNTLFLIKSAWKFAGRRDACRNTWCAWSKTLPIDYIFVVGRHEPVRLFGNPLEQLFGETDVLPLNLNDSFGHMTQKVLWGMRYAQQRGYEKVVVTDDDTYVCVPKMLHRLADGRPCDYVGYRRDGAGCFGSHPYMQGSAYIVGLNGITSLALAAETLTEKTPDDVAVGKILSRQQDINFIHEPRFWPGPQCAPVTDNRNLITTHKSDPQTMAAVHIDYILAAEKHIQQELNCELTS